MDDRFGFARLLLLLTEIIGLILALAGAVILGLLIVTPGPVLWFAMAGGLLVFGALIVLQAQLGRALVLTALHSGDILRELRGRTDPDRRDPPITRQP